MSDYPTVSLIGSGRVAKQLGPALAKKGVKIAGLYGRNRVEAEKLAARLNTSLITDLSDPISSDLILIMVSDDAIPETVNALHPDFAGIVAHTSGSVPLQSISDRYRRGVFYPLQSFSFDKTVVWENVPFCLEAENDEDLNILGRLAETLSQRIHILSSEQRQSLHLAAVFANNFANLMFEYSEEILEKSNIDRSILHPLILETANKILMQTASQAQTGPATRGDMKTIAAHRKLLGEDNTLRSIYDTLTNEIYRRTHGKDL